VWGRVRFGAMDMVPALVRVQVEAADSGVSRVHVRGTGREALIKHKIGAKADRRGDLARVALGPYGSLAQHVAE
jgi:hypothetical protein